MLSRSVCRVVLALAFVAAVGLAFHAEAQVRSDDDGLIPHIDFPDRFDIFDEPFPDREVTPIPEIFPPHSPMGQGPIPMVLIPGVGSDWTIWREFMERNVGLYTMYAVTLPGFGGSAPPPAAPDEDFGNLPYMRNAVKAILQFIDETGFEKPVLVGHGMGGHLAQWIGAKYPDKVRAVISVDGPPLVPLASNLLDNDRGLRRESIGRDMYRPLSMDSDQNWDERMQMTAESQVQDGERAQQVKRMYLNCFRGTFVVAQFEYYMSDLRKPMERMQVPTLLIAAAAPDIPGGPNRIKTRWMELIGTPANTTFVFLRDTRHFVMDDAPDTLDDLVRRFVYGLPIDDALVSVDGTAKPVNPELEKKAEGAPKQDAVPQKP